MEKDIKMEKTELVTMSPLVLAYLGDTVYETYIREYLIRQNTQRKVNDLHKLAIKYVKAKAQATIIHEVEIELTEEESKIYKRGRNQKSNTSPKNADIIDYKHATGFEALVGYLYLNNEIERLQYIINKGIKIIERDM
ncbi:TPA: Mini-ribonuclease 3 [Clostridioides difficile]|uniref:Mini-ribonuclease 3 n=2 Tax=Clostridioides difficile TaxID=1496 RepID=UPI000379F6DC|nr:ribonuclease III domain-containing protein [Clostridioides difficile]EQE84235.1 ribonuclease III domain protein [Clostridioides difficile CD68]EQF11788.1 ribonuclease III domain protein [Clostridioides difficile CD132]EQF34021.1 ribonuclease III domain protein [Clostridioides difficile CD159]EQF35214.1 ribonuclease III domain protein [Clostridioides difficile CD165]EQF42867.1 ribonuclease III domain protein [Clostridioides difficile CD169]EQF91123.1 ribonuclease III domain protein [Clostri